MRKGKRAGMKTLCVVLLFFFCGLFLICCQGPGQAQDSDMQQHRKHGAQAGKNTPGGGGQADMKLTPEQQDKLKKIRDAYMDRTEEMQLQIKEKRFEMMKLFRDQEPDRKKIYAKIDEIYKLECDRQRLMVDEFFEVRQVLTPEQARVFRIKTYRAMMKMKD
jgi:Spy/CpxP family protein refolding chaperone